MQDESISLRQRLLDAVIDGEIGKGIVVTRSELMEYFKDEKQSTLNSFLPNGEVDAKEKYGSTSKVFSIRIVDGKYRIHPDALHERMNEREILKTG